MRCLALTFPGDTNTSKQKHHYYKSPQPFDDMYIHPLEAAGYYVILYSPAFVFRLHWIGFAVYMAIMGTCGVLDHCGIEVCAPLKGDWMTYHQ